MVERVSHRTAPNLLPPLKGGQLTQLVMDGKTAELELRWVSALAEGYRNFNDFLAAAQGLAESGHPDLAGTLLTMLLSQLHDAERYDGTELVVERSIYIAPRHAEVRRLLVKLHEKSGFRGVEKLLSPLDGVKGDDHAGIRERVAKLLKLRPGTFVNGTVRVGPERVVEFRPEEKMFVLTDGETERTIAPDAAGTELTLLDSDDFRVLLRFDPERLQRMATDEPVGLIVSALKASKNRLEFPALKKLLARGVVVPTAFARWWNKVKGLIDRNPMIQVYGEKDPTLLLRTTPITHEEELKAKLTRSPSGLAKIDLVLEYLRSLDQGHDADPAFLGHCASELAAIAGPESKEKAAALVAASVLEDIAVRTKGTVGLVVDPQSVLDRVDPALDLALVLGDEEHSRLALEYVRAHGPDRWAKAFATALPSAPGRLAEALARELMLHQKGEDLGGAVSAILASPDRFGDGLLWLWKAATSGQLDQATSRIDLANISIVMLRCMNRWARAAKSQLTEAQRAVLPRMRQALQGNNYRTIDQIVDQTTAPEAIAMYRELVNNQGLTDANVVHLEDRLKLKHRDAILGKKEMWEEDVIWTSPAGLRQRQGEFDQLVNIEMVKNSEAIGTAAGFGDLSENAEFTAALEQRDFLSRRANEINEEIRKAQVIPPERVSTSLVTIGTTVKVKEVGKERTEQYTFLGPWDVKLEEGIYSYLAPFARVFLGKKRGDVVDVTGEAIAKKMEIVDIIRVDMPE